METANPDPKTLTILPDSPEAASIQTVTGWVSRNGYFCGKDERMARYNGSTHSICGCGAIIDKSYIRCLDCQSLDELDKYNAAKREKWDGKTPLYSATSQKYYFDLEELLEELDEEGGTIEGMRLYLCRPTKMREVDPEYWEDELPEETDLKDVASDEILAALAHLNKLIRENTEPISWWATETVADISEYAAYRHPIMGWLAVGAEVPTA